jgi:hypothetical protein
MKKMFDEKASLDEVGSYFISQLAWDGIPAHMINMKMIQEAKSSMSLSSFSREYGAQFTDETDGYFSPKKMHEATVPDGQLPCVVLKGDPNKKYIISIDSNYSNSETADYFAMGVFELDEETQKSTLVHGYGQAGLDLKYHIRYFYYLLTSFNVAMIIFDYAGHHQFLDSANESELFKKAGIDIKLIDFDSDKDGQEYVDQLKTARNQYNRSTGRIAFTQLFTSEFLRRANEHLQGSIDFKRVWFASRATAHKTAFDKVVNAKIDFDLFKKKDGQSIFVDNLDLLEEQEIIIYDTKSQCAKIKVGTTPTGRQTFDLPAAIKRDTGVNRVRKDNYTALLLGNWAVKCYFDIMTQTNEPPQTFTPIMLR